VVCPADDVTNLDVGNGRHDAVASLLNEHNHPTWPSLAAETELRVGHKVLAVGVVTCSQQRYKVR